VISSEKNPNTAVISSEQNQTKKRLLFKQLSPDYLFKQLRDRDPMQRGASRQVREMRQKRESYIDRPGPLLDVVCCHLVVCMVF
jgi:hypothetical protein